VKLRPGNEVNLTALDALILLAYHDIKRRRLTATPAT